MKASELKKALDPQVKRASQNAVQQVKNNIKKQNQLNKNMPNKKEETVRYVKASPFEGLKEIVDMKKQKAIANELDSLIYEQNKLKKLRESGNMTENQNKPRVPSPMETFIAANPDKLKGMTIEDVAKLSMFTNSGGSGGSDPLSMLMAMNMNKGSNGGGNNLQEKLLGMVIEKMFKDNNNNGNKGSSDNDLLKYVMQQNQQNQELLMKIILQKNEVPKQDQNNLFMKELFSMVKGQTDFENTFLREKINTLEMRQNSNDPLGEAKRMMDYITTFKGAFGAGNSTPESMAHDIKLKELTFEQARQVNEDTRRTANMAQIGEMINNTISTFGQILGEPIAEAAKSKIEQFTEDAKTPKVQKVRIAPEQPKNPEVQKVRISPEQLREEIDLGDLKNLETDLEKFENRQEEIQGRSSRFKVYETG